jgi:hypothetical protein
MSRKDPSESLINFPHGSVIQSHGPRDPDPDPQEIFANPEHCFFEIMVTCIIFLILFRITTLTGKSIKIIEVGYKRTNKHYDTVFYNSYRTR